MKTRTILCLVAMLILLAGGMQTTGQNVITSGTYMVVTSGSSVVSVQDLNVNSGGNIVVSGTLKLQKDFNNLNSSPYTVGTGTMEFSGTTGQNITGQNIIQNLTMNNAAGLTIGGSTRVNGNLTLTSGLITLGSNNLLLGPTAAVVGSPTASAMVVPTSTGELRKEYASAGSFTYPVGDATVTPEYSPVTLNYTAGTFASGNYAGVTLADAIYPNADSKPSYISRYWNISQSGITGASCNPAFTYVPADVVGTESDIYCFKVGADVNTWIAYNPTNTSTHQLTAAGLSTFGSFTGTTGTPGALPPANRSLNNQIVPNGTITCNDAVKVLYVAGNGTTYAVANGGSVHLIAGQSIFMEPGTTVALGGLLHAYISTDGHYCDGPIKEITADNGNNNETVNGNVAVENGLKVKIWPNPTPGKFTMEITGVEGQTPVDITIYDMQGKRILTRHLINEYVHEFSIANETTGIYNVRVFTGNNSATMKIVKTN